MRNNPERPSERLGAYEVTWVTPGHVQARLGGALVLSGTAGAVREWIRMESEEDK